MKQEIIIAGLIGLALGIIIAPIFSPVMPMMWGDRMMYRNSTTNSYQMMNQID